MARVVARGPCKDRRAHDETPKKWSPKGSARLPIFRHLSGIAFRPPFRALSGHPRVSKSRFSHGGCVTFREIVVAASGPSRGRFWVSNGGQKSLIFLVVFLCFLGCLAFRVAGGSRRRPRAPKEAPRRFKTAPEGHPKGSSEGLRSAPGGSGMPFCASSADRLFSQK